MKTKTLMCMALALGVCAPGLAHADIPRTINFQGRLADAAGGPQGGTLQMTFRVFDVYENGSACHTENQTLTLDSGLFSARVGDPSGISALCDFSRAYYLEVQVAGDNPLAPRVALLPAVYAFTAQRLAPPGLTTSHQVGNLSGNIPLSNSVQNANLNADLLEGHHWADVSGTSGQALYVLNAGCTNTEGDLTSLPQCTTNVKGIAAFNHTCGGLFKDLACPWDCRADTTTYPDGYQCVTGAGYWGSFWRLWCTCTTYPLAYLKPGP